MLLLSLMSLWLLRGTLGKPLDVNNRITALLSGHIDTSLQEKAEAIDTILRLLSEIDLVSICEAVAMNRPNVATDMDNIISQAAKERAFEFMLADKLRNAESIPFPADFNMKTSDILPVNFPLKPNAAPAKSPVVPHENGSPSDVDASTRVVIDKSQSLKPEVSLSAEARRLDSQEIARLLRPEIVGFKLVESEHYRTEMEGDARREEGVHSGTQAPVQSMLEGMVNYTSVNETEVTDFNKTTNLNATTDASTTTTTSSSSSTISSTTTISSTNATTSSTTAKIVSTAATISNNAKIPSTNVTTLSDNAKIPSTNTTTSANNAKITSTNTTTSPNNATIASTNATTSSDNATLSSTNVTISSTTATLLSTNATLASTNAAISSYNVTISTDNVTISSTNTTIASTNVTLSTSNVTNATISSTTSGEEVENITVVTSSPPSTVSKEFLDTTTSNAIIEEMSNGSLSNTSSVETAADAMNTSAVETAADAMHTTKSSDVFGNETQATNAPGSDTTQLSEEADIELKNDTIDEVIGNKTVAAKESLSHSETGAVDTESDHELSAGNSTYAPNRTEAHGSDMSSQNDTELSGPETSFSEAATTFNNETTTLATTTTTTPSPTTITTTTTTIATASSVNLTKGATPTITHVTDEVSIDYSTDQADLSDLSEEVPSTTVGYFWTPGITIPHQKLYDYDSIDYASSTYESRDNNVEDAVDVHDANTVQNETGAMTADAMSATQSDYDYIYNLLGLLGERSRNWGYDEDSKYDETSRYPGYDVSNLEYPGEDVTDFSIDALKTSPKVLTGDHFDDGHKQQGINMLASVDSPANTAAEDEFTLSAQPGYYNSLADQTSWNLADNEYKQNTETSSEDYDKIFTAHVEGSKHGVTSGVASSIGVQQKTVWSEPTVPQMLYHPNGYACPGLFGYYADITDCRAFFICSWGLPYRFLCPQGTLWNTAESVCDWANNVTCYVQIKK